MSRPTPTRRGVLALVAGAASVLAGCAGGGDDGGDGADGSNTSSREPATTSPVTPVTTSVRSTKGVTPTARPSPTGSVSPTTTGTATPGTTATLTTPPQAAYEAVARTFVGRLVAGEYERAREPFDDAMTEQVSADRLRTLWEQVTAPRGEFVEISETAVGRSGEFVVVDLVARFTGGRLVVRVVLRTVPDEPRLRIAGLSFPRQFQGSYSPPEYADRSAFTERTLSLSARSCSLPATLTLPEADGSVPGVVLVHGSGPQDRDQTIGPNKPFKDLAWGLATAGVAVLRYDKRTLVCDVSPADATLDRVVVDDALVAADRLRSVPAVRVDGVSVAGHSLGGMAAPRIAARDGDLAGAALLAANARPLHRLIPEQYAYLFRLDGSLSDAEREQLASVRDRADRIATGDYAPDETLLGFPGAFWKSLASYDQVATARSLSLPRLVAQGERDYQVPPDDELARWRDALGDDPSVAFRLYPALNHLLIPGEGDPTPTEYQRPGNVGEELVADLAAWVDSAAQD